MSTEATYGLLGMEDSWGGVGGGGTCEQLVPVLRPVKTEGPEHSSGAV